MKGDSRLRKAGRFATSHGVTENEFQARTLLSQLQYRALSPVSQSARMWERNGLGTSRHSQASGHPAECSLEPSPAAGPTQHICIELLPYGFGVAVPNG